MAQVEPLAEGHQYHVEIGKYAAEQESGSREFLAVLGCDEVPRATYQRMVDDIHEPLAARRCETCGAQPSTACVDSTRMSTILSRVSYSVTIGGAMQ